MYKKKTVYIEFSTICGFRHPLWALLMYHLWIRGNYHISQLPLKLGVTRDYVSANGACKLICIPLSTQNRGAVRHSYVLSPFRGSNPTLNPQMLTMPEGIPVEKQEGKKLRPSMSSQSKMA